MKEKIFNLIFTGSFVVFPKFAVYLLTGGVIVSLSKKVNGQIAYFDGNGVIYLGAFFAILGVVALIIGIIQAIRA